MKEGIKNIKTLTVHQNLQFIQKTIMFYCLNRKKIESENPTVRKADKGKTMVL